MLQPELAEPLAAAARLRNPLVHQYLDIDDRLLFASLGRLDDLRQYAAAIRQVAD